MGYMTYRKLVISGVTLFLLFCIVADGSFLGVNVGKGRITQGRNSIRGSWPWQALLLIKKRNNPKKLTLCGGSLLNSNWVLTSAECVENYSKIRLFLGVWNVSNHVEVGRRARSAYLVVTHPCYTSNEWQRGVSGDNLALILLDQPIYVFKPICLDGRTNDWNNLRAGMSLGGCIATGYGRTGLGGDAQILQQIQFSNVSQQLCSNFYGPGSRNNDIICAIDEKVTGKDTCKGDMGGPLMCPTSFGSCSGYYLAGMTLAGSVQCGNGLPGIYASIYPNMEWIRSVIATTRQNYSSKKLKGAKYSDTVCKTVSKTATGSPQSRLFDQVVSRYLELPIGN